MVHPQPSFTFPLTSNGVLLTNGAQKAECLATHIHTTLGSPDLVPTLVLPSSSHFSHEISTVITPQELTSTLLSLSTKKATGPDDMPNEFLRCLPDALLQLLLDRGLDLVHSWTARWGLTVSAQKSSLLCFTRRRIPNIPVVTINGSPMPFKSRHKFLGLLLDTPHLIWGCHIQYLVSSSLKRLNLMKSLAGVKWGVDRCTLLHFYCTYIRNRLDYGSDCEQPHNHFSAEASLPSLSHRCSTFLVRTYTKFASSPRCHALHSLLLQHGREPLHGPLPYQAHTPFVDRALSFFATLQSLFPFTHPHNGAKPVAQCRAGPYSLHSSTHGTTPTSPYTPTPPASLTLHPSVRPSTSPPGATVLRLPASASITTAELFAIKEGLQFATTLPTLCSIALFSDSLSALQIIKSHRPHSHLNLTLIIHHLILHLTSLGHTIHLQ
ncbi:hypothetical protein E2C01_050519 [Portunus trituberculatus]|uniref:RNase H type-1 domain-containing protein n=1 Tax=Portunus trituberculatus TaxID=210409 RepID=A0A5B7GH04_PORTR|nr:hypothetical protein [Portunus trituberculatus]